jgi:hypothetical protein
LTMTILRPSAYCPITKFRIHHGRSKIYREVRNTQDLSTIFWVGLVFFLQIRSFFLEWLNIAYIAFYLILLFTREDISMYQL